MNSPLEIPKVKHRLGRTWPILAAGLLFVGLSLAVWLLPELLVGWSLRPSSSDGQNGIDRLNGVDRTKAVTDTRQGVLFAAGGLIAIISLVITWLRHRIDRAKQDLDREKQDLDREKQDLDRDSDLRGRFAEASEQLGHERPAVRLAGVYAMAALADDWQAVGNLKQQMICVAVLCAYLRMPYKSGSKVAKSGEKEVRLTIIKTITERLQNPAAPNTWCGLPLDFTGVLFDGGNFKGANFTGGDVSFNNAEFTGGKVTFEEAKFTGAKVTFNNAKFTGGDVTFEDAKFIGGEVNFYFAKFARGEISFSFTEFIGGNVSFAGTQFTGEEYDQAEVSFAGAKFASGRVNFHLAKFTGAEVRFHIADFTGGEVTFKDAEFTGGEVTFEKVEFMGGEVIFDGAKFTGGFVGFDGAKFTGGNVDFNGASGSHKEVLSFTGPHVWTHPPHVSWGDGETPAWVSPDLWPPALEPAEVLAP